MSLDDHELGKKVPPSMPVKFEKVSFPKTKLHINNYFDKVKLVEKALNAPSSNKLLKKKSLYLGNYYQDTQNTSGQNNLIRR